MAKDSSHHDVLLEAVADDGTRFGRSPSQGYRPLVRVLGSESWADALIDTAHQFGFKMNVRTNAIYFQKPDGEPLEIQLRIEKPSLAKELRVDSGDRRAALLRDNFPLEYNERGWSACSVDSPEQVEAFLKVVAEAEAQLAAERRALEAIEDLPEVKRVRELIVKVVGPDAWENEQFSREWRRFLRDPKGHGEGPEFEAGWLSNVASMFRSLEQMGTWSKERL